MKTKDVVTGEAYALRRGGRGSPSYRVVALEKGLPCERGLYGRHNAPKDGVRVRNEASGAEFTIPSRELAEPWAQYEARRVVATERARVANERHEKEKAENARLVAVLAAVGVEAARAAGMGVVIPYESHGALVELCKDAANWRELGSAGSGG